MTSPNVYIDNLSMEDLIKKLEEAGLKTAEEPKGLTVTAAPDYRGNFGFFHVKGGEFESVLIKGVYKDNIRPVSGKPPFEDRTLNELAQTCADAERTLRHPVKLGITFDEENKHYIYRAEACEWTTPRDDMRDPAIPTPLTSVERSLGRGDFVSEKHLFIKNPFAEIMPETISPILMSLASGVPDIFNPLFVSSSIKTQSPSMKLLFGRLLLNSANAETIVPVFKQTTDFFLLNFMPSVFKKVKKPSFGVPNISDMQITDEEILETIKDIGESTASLETDDLYSDEFAELTALCVMAWEMIYIRLWQSFTSLHKYIGKDMTETLRHIYKTRTDTILNKDIQELHDRFDPACPPAVFKPLNIKHTDKEDMYKNLPAGKRLTLNRNKYMEKLSLCHSYLSMRDEMFTAFSALTGKARSLLLETGADLKENGMITDKQDIFYFELKEVKNILQDEFYGNIPFTINFRKWQNARFSALCMTSMLYEKDTEKAGELAKSQIEKTQNEKLIPSTSINHKAVSTDNYTFGRSFRLSELAKITGKEAAIAESASIVSFAAEYCIVNDIPLYTGARFANLILSGSKIHTSEDGIRYG